MVIGSRPEATFFSLFQLATLMSWNAGRPRGFGLRIVTDHADYPELAALYKHDRMSPLWFVHATQTGTVVITKALGVDYELRTVEVALAWVLRLDRLASAATWSLRLRPQRG